MKTIMMKQSNISDNKVSKMCSKTFLTMIISGILLSDISSNTVLASSFSDDTVIQGNVYFWNRDRVRKDIEQDKVVPNLKHTTINANVDVVTGYINDVLNFEVGGFYAWELSDGGPAYPNEIGLSNAKDRWSEAWAGDRSGFNFYKFAAGLKYDNYWTKWGYIQPSGQTLLAPHWSFLPGTYRGFEVGGNWDYGTYGALSASYMWTDRYKAPWYTNLYKFYNTDLSEKISYLHSAGMKYDFKNKLVVETAFGQAENFMNQYFFKTSYALPIADQDLKMSYQFYGAKDQSGHDTTKVYDGLAWLQALTFNYKLGDFDFRLEGTSVKANGPQGYFLQRMTPQWASSNGRLDIWWNSRSDFNANGEKSIFFGTTYDLSSLLLPGLSVGASYVYAWDAKPNSLWSDQSAKISESAWNLDLGYTFQTGQLKGATAGIHYTNYNNRSNNPSWGGGYGNMFQDERDVKITFIVPFSAFSSTAKNK